MYHVILGIMVTALAVTAPVPKEVPPPTVATLRQALGKSHLGKEVRVIGRQLGEYPVIKYSGWRLHDKDVVARDGEDNQFYLEWKSKGMDIHVLEGKVTAIWVFNEGADEHKRYQGQLPGALTFDDNQEAIEKKLGKPDEVDNYEPRRVLGKGPLVEDRFLNYSSGTAVLLRRPKGGQWAIHYISLWIPSKDD